MASFPAILKQLRRRDKITQDQLSAMLKISRSAVSMYESGKREPDFEILEAIADLFNVDMNYLLGKTSTEHSSSIPPGFAPMPELETVPRVGRIACGTPILADENIEEYDSVPRSWGASMTLLCRGDSMAPSIQDGDLVAIRRQPEVENGEIAAVRLDDEATLKRVYLYPTYIELRPENPAYASIIKIGEEMNSVTIEGKVVGLCRAIY